MAPFLTNSISATSESGSNLDGITSGEMSGNGQSSQPAVVQDQAVDTEFLIVGAGPAGASLACFLGSHGMFLD